MQSIYRSESQITHQNLTHSEGLLSICLLSEFAKISITKQLKAHTVLPRHATENGSI